MPAPSSLLSVPSVSQRSSKSARRHANAVVTEHQELLITKEVDLNRRRICVMCVLEQLAERSRDACDLLTAEHVDCPRPGAKACIANPPSTRRRSYEQERPFMVAE